MNSHYIIEVRGSTSAYLGKIAHTFPLTHFLLPGLAFPARKISYAITFTRLEGYFDLLDQVYSLFRDPCRKILPNLPVLAAASRFTPFFCLCPDESHVFSSQDTFDGGIE